MVVLSVSLLRPVRITYSTCRINAAILPEGDFDVFVQRWSATVSLHLFVDDSQLESQGEASFVRAEIVAAHADFADICYGSLETQLAPDKQLVLASTPKLQQQVAADIGAERPTRRFAAVLGVDATAGQYRTTAKTLGTKRAGRWQTARRKWRKLRQITTAASARNRGRCRHLARSAVHSLMSWGAEVFGLNDSELRSLRSLEAQVAAPCHKGACPHTILAIAGDGTWRAAVAPILGWHRQVWLATLAPTEPLVEWTLPDLRQAFAEQSAIPPTYWSKVRGPVGAHLLALRRIG